MMDDESLRGVTASQREYLALVSLRLSSKQIARIVGRSEKSIDVACTRALKAANAHSRFELADRLVATDPELLHALIQRFSLSTKTLAQLRSGVPDEQADGAAAASFQPVTNDLPVWKKRMLAMAVAFGTLALASVLIRLAHEFLRGAAALH